MNEQSCDAGSIRTASTPPGRGPRNPAAGQHLKTWRARPDRVCGRLGRWGRVTQDAAHLPCPRVTQDGLRDVALSVQRDAALRSGQREDCYRHFSHSSGLNLEHLMQSSCTNVSSSKR